MDLSPEFLFQSQSPPLSGGGGGGGGGGGSSSSAVDEAYMKGLYAGLNLRSLLGGSGGSFAPPNDAVSVDTTPFPPPKIENLPSLVSLEESDRRRRRQKVSEKARRLQELLPTEKKMSIAAVLEETCKYVRFLEAQITALRSMPRGGGGGERRSEEESGGGGELARLSRQEVLQAAVNSPAAQALLYSNGCCVYSAEQMVLIKERDERREMMRRLYESTNPNSSPLFSAW